MSDAAVNETCERCGNEGAEKRRQNTAYTDDERNYTILCPPCQEENDRYWRDMWAEYYDGCL